MIFSSCFETQNKPRPASCFHIQLVRQNRLRKFGNSFASLREEKS